jgi:hypothetical protein
MIYGTREQVIYSSKTIYAIKGLGLKILESSNSLREQAYSR